MITATPRPVAYARPHPHTPSAPTLFVRTARREDAAALAALSQPFVRTGALRERPLSLYAAQAADFLVVEDRDGTFGGCVGLRAYPAAEAADRAPAGVVYNFCVAGHRQGGGVGAGLLRAVLARARTQGLGSLFTATTGGGGLFLRYGFAPVAPGLAPAAWATSLDPRRNAQVLMRIV
ncbi:hypothetical protein GCM10018785_45750 [Streptomyces longispororuber]|uniref:N-acetyltransferase domain-containing protein n=1 Tax=Streptomyces longispororuber TaxID=68230 RepID=A0A918ZV66_9ACTN|nr:hypothetical protein GCM10018785_45750 [Streptomyces longispororuber]